MKKIRKKRGTDTWEQLIFSAYKNLFGEDSVKETGSLMQSLGGKKGSDRYGCIPGRNREWPRMVQEYLNRSSGVESVVFGGRRAKPEGCKRRSRS